MEFGSGITEALGELIEGPWEQPGMTQTMLTQTLAGRTHVVTSWRQGCGIETQSCLLH